VLTVGYDELVISEAGLDIHRTPSFPWMGQEHVNVLLPGSTPLCGSRWTVEARLLDVTPERIEMAERNDDPNQAYLDAAEVAELHFRRRQAGDRFQPLGMDGRHQTLRDFMINAKIPAMWRDLVPIAVCGDRIAWVAGWRMDERFKVRIGTRRLLHLALVEMPSQ
jgi:tRNA(Ile)-lysidine synthase